MAGELVKGSRRPQPILRKYRQPVYDEEKVGNGAAPTSIAFFTRPRGQQDNAAHTKTERDTNIQAANQLGALQEFYLVGFVLRPDLDLQIVDEAGAAPADASNELEILRRIFNDSLLTYTFGRQQPLVEMPTDQIPWGVGPQGCVYNNIATPTANSVSHLVTLGLPSVREFYDVRLTKARPRHVQPDMSFSSTVTWPNGSLAILTAGNYARVMLYMIGILLTTL